MTHTSDKQRAGNNQRPRTTSKLYSISFLTVLFLLLVSVGANKSMTQDVKGKRGESKAECDYTEDPNAVTIVFKGLFYFSFPKGESGTYRSECKVGILSTRQDHMLYVAFSDIEGSKNLVFPHPALQSMSEGIYINKFQDGTTPPVERGTGVTICGGFTAFGGWGKPSNRNAPRVECPCNFNWIIDFEGEELHDENINEKSGTLRPMLHLKTGLLRTRNRSTYPYNIIQNGIFRKFGYVAETIDAFISLNADEHVEIKLGQEVYQIPRGGRVEIYNVRYEDRPVVRKFGKTSNPGSASAEVDMRDSYIDDSHLHDDSQIYYDDLLDVADAKKRVHFIPSNYDSLDPKRARPFICFATGGSKE